MLKIFTTPNIMQRYLVDPITYRFTSHLKEIYPNPVFTEDYDRMLLHKDKRVADSLRRVMKSYKGFKCRRNGDSYMWYHPMKPTANYTGNMLVISLMDNGSLYQFSTHIVLGKKKRNCYAVTVFGYIAALSFLVVAGLAGGLEHDLMTIPQFIIRTVITLGIGALCGFIESKINPVFCSEEEAN